MKRIFIILAAAMMAVNAMGQLAPPKVEILGDLHPYRFAYIIPAGSVISSSGAGAVIGNVVVSSGTKTANPSEIIAGYLIKQGYTILPEIVPELAEETMIFAYGRTGTRPIGIFAYASKIIIQITNGKSHELLATIEAEGCGENETDDISQALYDALNVFSYSFDPKIVLSISSVSQSSIYLDIYNETPNAIKHIVTMVSYYENDSLVHTQKAHISFSQRLASGNSYIGHICRDKVARNKNMEIKIEIIGYE